MKKIDQTGFTALHILLILVLIGIIGFTGWKVYDASKAVKTPESGANPATANKEDPNTPPNFAELKVGSLILYYPKTQGPLVDTTDKSTKPAEDLFVRSYKLKDVELLVQKADDYVYTMGLGVFYQCAYNKNSNSFVGKQFENTFTPLSDCSKRTSFSGISFFTHEIVYEGFAQVRYLTATKDKKYIIYISSNSVSLNFDDNNEKLIADDKAKLNTFMEQFVPANKNVLLGLSK